MTGSDIGWATDPNLRYLHTPGDLCAPEGGRRFCSRCLPLSQQAGGPIVMYVSRRFGRLGNDWRVRVLGVLVRMVCGRTIQRGLQDKCCAGSS